MSRDPQCYILAPIPRHSGAHCKGAMTLNSPPLVGLFVTCLVDVFRPSVAFAAIKLIEAGGGRVEVPSRADLLRTTRL